jgi:hypothetical protein
MCTPIIYLCTTSYIQTFGSRSLIDYVGVEVSGGIWSVADYKIKLLVYILNFNILLNSVMF